MSERSSFSVKWRYPITWYVFNERWKSKLDSPFDAFGKKTITTIREKSKIPILISLSLPKLHWHWRSAYFYVKCVWIISNIFPWPSIKLTKSNHYKMTGRHHIKIRGLIQKVNFTKIIATIFNIVLSINKGRRCC